MVSFNSDNSENAHARAPHVLIGGDFWVDEDLVGEGVGVGGGDGRDMVFVAVDYGDDFVRGFLEGFGHGAANLEYICLGAWGSECHIQSPLLPTHILVGFTKEIRLAPPLLEELHNELAPPALVVCSFYGAHKGYGALVNQSLEVDIVNSGEGKVEEVAGEWQNGGEVSVEEDGVENGFDDVFDTSQIGEDVDVVLGSSSWLHARIWSSRGFLYGCVGEWASG